MGRCGERVTTTERVDIITTQQEGSSDRLTVLVAAATANTAGHVVRELSASGKVDVLAFVRKTDDPRVAAFKELPNVSLVQGDLDEPATVEAAMDNANRAFLVSSPFAYEQFERELFFVQAAHARGIPIVRVSTSTILIGPGTSTCYARVHHGIEAYQAKFNIKMVNLRPNLYMDNFIASAGEIKGAGQISYPASGDHARALVGTEDVGSAAALILQLNDQDFDEFANEKVIEIHGPEKVSFKQQCAALSAALGYEVKFNPVTQPQFEAALTGVGMKRIFAHSFAKTIAEMGGAKSSEELWGSDEVQDSSPSLTKLGWEAKVSVQSWANMDRVKLAFKRDDA